MFNPKELFKNRLTAHLKLLNRYLRYIFNGHFMIALMFIIITVAIYYQRWLQTVPDTFPVALLIALALSFVTIYNPIQSFLKEPDQAFLIVKEKEMSNYFQWTLVYNYTVQLYVVAIVLAVTSPLYLAFYSDRGVLLNGLIVFTVLIVKAWNMVLNWKFIQLDNRSILFIEKVIRIVLTFSLFYTIITLEYFVIIGLIYVIYLNVALIYAKKETRLNWLRLIAQDAERLAFFYRFVSLFAQVPHVKSRMRKRSLLVRFVQKYTPFEPLSTYTYLYRLTFLRSGEYFSLFIRLTVLAILLIIFVPNVWLKLALAVLFMYMTSFQMQTLFYHHRLNVWTDLYPLGKGEKEAAFISIAMQVSLMQTILLSITFLSLGNYIFFLLMLLAGTFFNYTFHQFYVKKKIQTVG